MCVGVRGVVWLDCGGEGVIHLESVSKEGELPPKVTSFGGTGLVRTGQDRPLQIRTGQDMPGQVGTGIPKRNTSQKWFYPTEAAIKKPIEAK